MHLQNHHPKRLSWSFGRHRSPCCAKQKTSSARSLVCSRPGGQFRHLTHSRFRIGKPYERPKAIKNHHGRTGRWHVTFRLSGPSTVAFQGLLLSIRGMRSELAPVMTSGANATVICKIFSENFFAGTWTGSWRKKTPGRCIRKNQRKIYLCSQKDIKILLDGIFLFQMGRFRIPLPPIAVRLFSGKFGSEPPVLRLLTGVIDAA